MAALLSTELLAHLSTEASRQLGSEAELEPVLAKLLDDGRRAWPALEIVPADFMRHIAQRLPAHRTREALESIHGADLYLACGCTLGQRRALSAFQERLLPEIERMLERRAGNSATAQEVVPQLLEKLFVPGEGRLRIAEYSGRGQLLTWLRAAATRLFIDLKRKEKGEESMDDGLADKLAADGLPAEMAFVKSQYREHFAEAFKGALLALAPRERAVLRMHTVEGLNIDQIGAFYRVHRTTAFRWIEASKASLLEQTRARLTERLKVAGTELDSIIAQLTSQLDLSISRYLREK